MKKIFYSWQDVETAANRIVLDIFKTDPAWKPDYIVGITRGGLPLATILSHRLGVPLVALSINLRDNTELGCETNCWLADWAFGYVDEEQKKLIKSRWDPKLRKNILVVDDINDTGATFEWLVKDWQSSCFPNEQNAWDAVWHRSVKFAVMTNNLSSSFNVDFAWDEVNKTEEDCWLVYPWENDAWLKKT